MNKPVDKESNCGNRMQGQPLWLPLCNQVRIYSVSVCLADFFINKFKFMLSTSDFLCCAIR